MWCFCFRWWCQTFPNCYYWSSRVFRWFRHRFVLRGSSSWVRSSRGASTALSVTGTRATWSTGPVRSTGTPIVDRWTNSTCICHRYHTYDFSLQLSHLLYMIKSEKNCFDVKLEMELADFCRLSNYSLIYFYLKFVVSEVTHKIWNTSNILSKDFDLGQLKRSQF